MYLTAQRLYSLKTTRTGINAFLYRHGQAPVPGMSWDRPIVERVADEYIGTRGPEHVEVAPGGNRVVSFVDIVTADATPAPQIEEAVREFKATFSTDSLPASMTVGAVAIRFGAQYGLFEGAREELAAIAAEAMSLLQHPG